MQKKQAWSTRLNNGKGSKIYLNDKKAEEYLKQGCLIVKKCKKGEL